MREKDDPYFQRNRGRKHLPVRRQIYESHEHDLCGSEWREQNTDHGLLGIPLRVIVSPRNIKQGVVEVVSRDKTLQTQIKMEEAAEQIKNYL